KVWRKDQQLFAEVALEQATEVDGFAIQPALLDAALHALALTSDEQANQVALPFAWSNAQLLATGASSLRVRFDLQGAGAALQIADASGQPLAVATIQTRP